MKTFKQMTTTSIGTLITVDPIHGLHAHRSKIKFPGFKSKEKGTVITALPVHGKHAKNSPVKKIKEDFDSTWDVKSEVPGSREHDANYPNLDKHIKSLNHNKHIAKSIDDLHHKLHSQQRFKSLIPNHQEAIKDYTSDSSFTNHALIGQARDKTPLDPDHAKDIGHLDNALKKHTLDRDLHVYHGAGFNPGKEAAKNREGKIHLPAFTSTSINHMNAAGFSHGQDHTFVDNKDGKNNTGVKNQSHVDRHIIHFHVPEGHHGFYAGDHSASGNEHEFIMPRGVTAKIDPKPTIVHDIRKARGISKTDEHTHWHIWHAKVADDSAYKNAGMKIRKGIGSY